MGSVMLRDFEQFTRLALSSVRASLEAGPSHVLPNLTVLVAIDVVVTDNQPRRTQETEDAQ